MLSKHQRLVDYALKHAHKSVGKNIHVSLLVIRNKVIVYGVNSYLKTHPQGSKSKFFFRHSELDCISKFNFRENNIKRATLYNFRFARRDYGLLMSKPCLDCMKLCDAFDIRKIYYSSPEGFHEI